MVDSFAVVVPWHNARQLESFKAAWKIEAVPPWLVLQQDAERNGCAATKNAGVLRAMNQGADIVVVIDDDCYPHDIDDLESFAHAHIEVLNAEHDVEMFQIVTDPPSRGTPYSSLHMKFKAAASVGFWTEIGDYCAVRQLAHNGAPMRFKTAAVIDKYFPLCGMNLAFRPSDWLPWCSFIDVPRFDDIWMGWLWQKEAWRRRYCFALSGPLVRHARQSNVWANLQAEAKHLEATEQLWQRIAASPASKFEELVELLPVSQFCRPS